MKGTVKVLGQDVKLTEHFVDSRGYALMGDSRGITVPQKFRQEVFQWAGENKIIVEWKGSMGGIDLWYVKDEASRTWFRLKWSS